MNSLFYQSNKNLDDIFKEFNTEIEEDILKNTEEYPTPTELRISTMTVTAETNLKLNLDIIYQYIDIIDYYDVKKEGILKISYGDMEPKGIHKKDITNKKKKTKKVFYNQSTIIIRAKINDDDIKEVNLKLFTNGSVQMTGLKNIEMSEKVVNILYQECLRINDIIQTQGNNSEINNKLLEKVLTKDNNIDIKLAIENPTEYNLTNINIVLINSDFSTYFNIKRDILHDILTKDYNLASTYEPCIYPGINCKYYWNTLYKDRPKKGVCYCNQKCLGKGEGYEVGKCRKITIAIFQSGNIIITGARSFTQLRDTYQYINEILKDNYQTIKRNELPILEEDSLSDNDTVVIRKRKKKKKIILLNVDKIKH